MRPNIQLLDGETILIEAQPKPATVWLWISRGAIHFVTTFVILMVLIYLKAGGFRLPLYGLVVVLFIILGAVSYFWLNSTIKRHWYFITNERCINYLGMMGINKQITLLSRIVDVDMSQSPTERMFGVSSVVLQLPGMLNGAAANNVVIYGLSLEDAEKITHLISEKMRDYSKQK